MERVIMSEYASSNRYFKVKIFSSVCNSRPAANSFICVKQTYLT